jgi:hypothetical protein
VSKGPVAFAPSNKPGTCLFCGRKIRLPDVFFCGHDCAATFAVAAVRLGFRFQPPGSGPARPTAYPFPPFLPGRVCACAIMSRERIAALGCPVHGGRPS